MQGFDLRVQPIVPVVGGCYYYSTGSGITGGLKSSVADPDPRIHIILPDPNFFSRIRSRIRSFSGWFYIKNEISLAYILYDTVSYNII